ncbi:MAG: hypothetical protein ABL925_06000 [Methylococcales bacterium]
MNSKKQPELGLVFSLILQLALAGGLDLAAVGTVYAEDIEFIQAPWQSRKVEERDLSGNVIQHKPVNNMSGGSDGNSARIELGPSGAVHKTSLGPTFAEAYSSFNTQTQTPTYWASVNDYPGSPNAQSPHNSGLSTAQVEQYWRMRKLSDNASVTLHVTGGRLQLVDYVGREPLAASVQLEWQVNVYNAGISDGQNLAVLTGHGGTTGGSETFDYTSQGFQLSSYTEQMGYSSSNTVGATLVIPAQDIEMDISSIFPLFDLFSTGEFSVYVKLKAEALALYADGGAAMAFLRDPTSAEQADPSLGGFGLSFTGVELLAPVPLPASWLFFLAGSGLLAGVSRHAGKRNPLAATTIN